MSHNHDAMTHTHGLQDDCPRCQQYADDPTLLDDANTIRLWRGDCHTALDRAAQSTLYRHAVVTQRLIASLTYEEPLRLAALNRGSVLQYLDHATPKRTVDELFEVYDRRDVRAASC